MHARSTARFLTALLLVVGCGGDDGQGDATTVASGTTDVATTDVATTDVATTSAADSSAGEGDDAQADSSGEALTNASADSGGDSGSGGSESTGAGPTTGPGVLPGETGLDSFCRRYVECGGTYYEDEQACIDASLDYWGSCPTRQAALDAFGGCMSEIECRDWSPDAYNPSSTPCAGQWDDLGNSEPCA